MPVSLTDARRRDARVQASLPCAARRWAAPWLLGCCLLAGCHDPLAAPVDLFHNLEGGQIAAQRPPPPGAGLPYPKLGTVPAKPVLSDPAFRRGLQAQLIAERDRRQRLAADSPVAVIPPPPPPAPPPPPTGPAAAGPAGAAPMAAATLDTAEAPAPKPPAFGPAAGTPVTWAGAPPDSAGIPTIPDAPPAPASFEGVPAQPAPTAIVLPAGLAPPPGGTEVYFAAGGDQLLPSQTQALKDFLSHRRHQPIEIIGLGEAAADTPDGQATAIGLAVRRAQAVQAALVAMHVRQADTRIGARAFGRGAVLKLL